MLEQNEYLITWGVYFAGAVGALLVWWRMTKPLPWAFPKLVLRVIPAALILVPAPMAADRAELAPALIVWLFDTLLVKEVEAERVLMYLGYSLALAVVIIIVDSLIHFIFRRGKSTQLS